MTISINLDDLTQEHIDRCAPYVGKCSYAAPCIIGALTGPLPGSDGAIVDLLVSEGVIHLPANQIAEAVALQGAFDDGNISELSRLLGSRGLEWPGE